MKLPISVCRVDTPDGVKDYVTCLSHEHVFSRGLSPQAIIGVLLRPMESGEKITPEGFARNRVFVDFMHGVIARRGPQLPGLLAEARRQQNGFVYVIDQRTATPQGAVPLQDILGAFQIKDGEVVPNSYTAIPEHQIFTADGFFDLGSELNRCLLEEMYAL